MCQIIGRSLSSYLGCDWESQGAKVGERQVALARKSHAAGIIDAAALDAIEAAKRGEVLWVK